MNYKFLLIFVLSGLVSNALYAQVKGIVRDESGEPVVAANVFWMSSNQGTTTDADGQFSIPRHKGLNQLIVSFIGYANDTIDVSKASAENLVVNLHPGLELNEVEVKVRRIGLMKSRMSVLNQETITSAELTRAACCNLGESFTTNPSVDVGYSDAATGAKQIKLLGLAGSYVQMLTENIPNYRGAGQPFSLGYIPGTWMESIQVSKGASSVKNGYEAIAGQINVEFKKPQQVEQEVNVNLYANSKQRYEGNIDANIHLNKRLSTSILGHYEYQDAAFDRNNDGFLDMPHVKQFNLQNRWAWMGERYLFQASVKALKESRISGQTQVFDNAPQYVIDIQTERYEAFAKNAYLFNKEKNTSLALILSGSIHKQDAGFGLKQYDVNQKNAYASLLFETDFSKMHKFSTGLSLNHDSFNQNYRLTNEETTPLTRQNERETVAGAYAQYTFNWNDKLIVMAGLRGDRSNLYGNFVTPRLHLKWNPSEAIHVRASAGKGYRTPHALAENNTLLASSRRIIMDETLKQEAAWNYGVSSTFYIPLFGENLTLNAEYFYTDFQNQLVVDLDANPHEVRFTNLGGKSYSHTAQMDATYPFFKGFNLTAGFRWTDARSTYGGQLLERPLTSRYKGLVTASYKTPMDIWQFDATWQLNGGGRLPKAYTQADGSLSWDERYHSFSQLSAQVTRHFRHFSIYAGGENLTDFMQKNPIVGADNPWGDTFDSSLVWGPMDGRMFYAGIRVKI